AGKALAYGTLRHLGYLRFALARLASRPPRDSRLSALLCVAIHQLEHTAEPHYAVVDRAVECAAQFAGRAAKPFANAVLRGYLRRRTEIRPAAERDPEARWSYPRWWIDRLRLELGREAERVLELGNRHPPMTLRVNRRRTTPHAYLGKLQAAGMQARAIGPTALMLQQPVPVKELPGFDSGEVSVQDAGAQLAAPLLGAAAGTRVLDACAAPGGKTAHLLELADVELLALDRDPARLLRVEQNLARLGLTARILSADAGDLERWWDGLPFDRVLLDVPCSASGVVRRHPDIKWLRRPQDLAGFGAQQRRLLDALWQVLRRGGKFLYVTCSVFREENQVQIEQFVARHPDARLLPCHEGEDGLLLPSEERDGFYHALLEKV
ncbi:MAG: 16S rRNA (cytosine(967)-C(5))-methyltransferase RsmB, partial [Burkholderiales bacterium]